MTYYAHTESPRGMPVPVRHLPATDQWHDRPGHDFPAAPSAAISRISLFEETVTSGKKISTSENFKALPDSKKGVTRNKSDS